MKMVSNTLSVWLNHRYTIDSIPSVGYTIYEYTNPRYGIGNERRTPILLLKYSVSVEFKEFGTPAHLCLFLEMMLKCFGRS